MVIWNGISLHQTIIFGECVDNSIYRVYLFWLTVYVNKSCQSSPIRHPLNHSRLCNGGIGLAGNMSSYRHFRKFLQVRGLLTFQFHHRSRLSVKQWQYSNSQTEYGESKVPRDINSTIPRARQSLLLCPKFHVFLISIKKLHTYCVSTVQQFPCILEKSYWKIQSHKLSPHLLQTLRYDSWCTLTRTMEQRFLTHNIFFYEIIYTKCRFSSIVSNNGADAANLAPRSPCKVIIYEQF